MGRLPVGKQWVAHDGLGARWRRMKQVDRQLERVHGDAYRRARQQVRAWAVSVGKPLAVLPLVFLAKRKSDESGVHIAVAIEYVLERVRAGLDQVPDR